MNIKLDKMQYQFNHLSYYLGFLAIAFNVLYIFKVLEFLTPDVYVGIKILLNIVLLLLTFLAMEKAKVYSKPYAIVLIMLGIVCLARIFYVPMLVFNKEVTLKAGQEYHSVGILLFIYLVAMSLCYFGAGIVAFIKHIRLKHYLAKTDYEKIVAEFY